MSGFAKINSSVLCVLTTRGAVGAIADHLEIRSGHASDGIVGSSVTWDAEDTPVTWIRLVGENAATLACRLPSWLRWCVDTSKDWRPVMTVRLTYEKTLQVLDHLMTEDA